MRNVEKDAVEQAKKRQSFLEHGFELFSRKSIEAISMQDVANASGHGIATLYRYFSTKADFALAIAQWKWSEFFAGNRKRRPGDGFEGKTAADMFEFCLESFLDLYRGNKDLLRFNQLFNVYLRSGEVPQETVEIYRGLMQPVADFFRLMYERGKLDGTIRTDVPEEEMLSATVHLMLAVVTRYAVGLVYQPKGGFDDERELEMQKQMLYREYTVH